MSNTNVPVEYSSTVHLSLVANGQSFRLAQVGPEFIIPAEPINLPPCEAEVVVTVDGRDHRRIVSLVEGASSGNRRAQIVAQSLN